MRSLRIIGLVICVMLLSGAAGWAAVVDYFNYQAYGGTWSDANKTWVNDSNMCWAATASNVLEWTGWGNVAGLSSAQGIFTYFTQHWTNSGGDMEYGWEWWLDGVNDMQGSPGWSQVKVSGGDFYPTANFSQYFFVQSNASLAMTSVKSYLQAGDGVGLGIYTRNGAHAITCWGIRYNSSTNQALGVWVTDSDDAQGQATPVPTLQYYGVNYLNGRYYLANFYGTTNVWYIGDVEALARMPVQAPTPTTNWVDTTDTWATSNNWDNGVPTSGSKAVVDNGGTAQINSAASAKELDIGVNTSGNVQLLSGSLSLSLQMILGAASGSNGTFTMNSGSFSAPTVYVGQSGKGAINQNGGTANVGTSLNVGSAAGSQGQYNLQAGTLQAPTENIGGSGAGTFNQTGGTNTISTLLNIGNGGVYNAGKGATLTAKNLTVGAYGQFNITDATASVRLTGDLTFSDHSHYSAVSGSRIVMGGGSVYAQMMSLSDLAGGFANTEFVFDGGKTKLSQFSFSDDGSSTLGDNYYIRKLTLGDTVGAGLLRLVDPYNSGFSRYYGEDILSLSSLSIGTGSYLDLNGFMLAVSGNVASTLNSLIASGMLRDSSVGGKYYLSATYNSTTAWTTVQEYYGKAPVTGAGRVTIGPSNNNPFLLRGADYIEAVPEPSAIVMLCLGAIAAGGAVARRLRR